jgi:hypothetical protein
MADYVLNRHFEEASLSRPVKLIDGHDIMKNYGLAPGPRIGQLLEAVKEAQAAGEVTDRQEALRFVERLLKAVGDIEKKRMKE